VPHISVNFVNNGKTVLLNKMLDCPVGFITLKNTLMQSTLTYKADNQYWIYHARYQGITAAFLKIKVFTLIK